jgi:type IV pilus assembly protein PilC
MSQDQNHLGYTPEVVKANDHTTGPGVRRGWAAQLAAAWLEVTAWAIVAIVAITLALAMAFGIGWAVLAIPALVFIVLMFPFVSAAIASVRRRRATAVLGYVEQAVRLNLPLGPILNAAAVSERGPVAQRLRDLRQAVEGSLPIAPALAYAVPEMPARSIGLIQYGETVGSLPQTLDRLIHGEVSERQAVPHPDRSFARWYLPTLIFIAIACITMISVYVLPKFHDILHDMGVPYPRYFAFLEQFDSTLVFAAVAAAIVVVFMCGINLRSVFRGQQRNPIRTLVTDQILWFLPISHGLQMDRALADVSRAVGDALAMGRPLDVALHEAADQLDMNFHMQKRLRDWLAYVSGGRSPEDGARAAGMPAFFVGMIGTANSLADQNEVFVFLSRYYSSRFRRHQAIIEGAIVPAVALVMGLVVVGVALSIFLPMNQMVEHLSGLYGK